jgi:hypothetical protein
MIIRSFGASRQQVGTSVPAAQSDQERPAQAFDPMMADWQSVMPPHTMLQDTLFGYMQMPPWDDLGGKFGF